MYTPKKFKEDDTSVLLEFIERHEFATVVSSDDDQLPLATHIPVSLFRNSGQPTLFGHMAKANPQWRTMHPDRPILVVFQGPHAYITPRWYEQTEVPTWNYAAVHVYGKPRIIADPDLLLDRVTRQVQTYEGTGDSAFRVDELSPSALKNNLRGIVGFELAPDRMQASFKLSQNRDPADYSNVIAGLFRRRDVDSLGVARMMTERRSSAVPTVEISPGVTLRRARRDDVDPIVRLLADDQLGRVRDNPDGPVPAAYLRGFDMIDDDPNQTLLVLESEGRTIGTMQLTFIPGLSHRGGSRMLIEAVRVSSGLRGKGLGQRMMLWVIEYAKQSGCRMIQLTTDKRRTDAHRFYERLGFVASHEGMKLVLTPEPQAPPETRP